MAIRYDKERIHKLFLNTKGDIKAVMQNDNVPRSQRTIKQYAKEGKWYEELSESFISDQNAITVCGDEYSEYTENRAETLKEEKELDVPMDADLDDIEKLEHIKNVIYQFLIPNPSDKKDGLELKLKTYGEAVKCYLDIDSRINEKKSKSSNIEVNTWEEIIRCCMSPNGEFDKKKWFQKSDYEPHPSQEQLHLSNARFRVVVAGRRFGKSLLAAKEAEAMILKPPTRGWIVSKTYDLGEKVFREIHKNLTQKFELDTVKKGYSSRSGSMYLEFPRGSVVEVKSADHPDSLVGEGLDWLVFDECASCKASIWEQYLRPTLSDKNGWALFISTPRGYNWFYDLWKRGNDPDYPEWESFRFPSWDNPHLFKEDIEEARRTLSKNAFEQEYGASFTLSSGQVYSDFDESIHVLQNDQIKIDSKWTRFRSIDFGYENPFVCLYIAVDPEDRVIIYDEYYRRHGTMEQHAEFLLEEEQRLRSRMQESGGKKYNKDVYEFTTCDPSGASARATLSEKGIVTVAPKSNVLQGLELVRQQLKIREDGKPGLYISSKCANTIREFNLYSYPDAMDTEEPVKDNDHAMDCLRYFLVQWLRGYITQKIAVYA